jgi:hypothetical protein
MVPDGDAVSGKVKSSYSTSRMLLIYQTCIPVADRRSNPLGDRFTWWRAVNWKNGLNGEWVLTGLNIAYERTELGVFIKYFVYISEVLLSSILMIIPHDS